MSVKSLGRLEQVELRSVWLNEAGDFTPWLAQDENLSLLSDAIGIPLTLEAQEKDVGPFRADILCQETDTDHWVLIENQIEKTDHTHLGQILTYAAGLQAVTIVWVAKKFTDEHRAALDWLNEVTEEGINFFGLEVELWRIGDSAVAPKFNVVSQPNNWTKSTRADVRTGVMTESKALQLEFWTAFAQYLEQNRFSLASVPRPAPKAWMPFSIGRSGFFVSAIGSTFDNEKNAYGGELRMELVINGPDAGGYFSALQIQAGQLDTDLGETLSWYEAAGVKMRRIYLRQSVDIYDRERWPEYYEWLHVRLVRFLRVFRPIVASLQPVTGQAASE